MGYLLGWVGFVASVQSVGLHFNSLGLNIGHSDKNINSKILIFLNSSCIICGLGFFCFGLFKPYLVFPFLKREEKI